MPMQSPTVVPGGTTPQGEVVLLLGAMNKVLRFDEHSSIVTCEAGVILKDLEAWATEHGCTVPLDLGSKGRCVTVPM